MQKNYIPQVLFLTLAVVVVFSVLSLIDFERVKLPFGIELKNINIVSDILSDDELPFADTVAVPLPPQEVPCPAGVECFRNYIGNQHPLQLFAEKIKQAKAGKAQVRVAWYGDSFTEADLVVGDIRDTMQTLFGGQGVGFMPITYEAPGFRRTVGHSFDGWDSHSLVTEGNAAEMGIGGMAFKPLENSYVRYTAAPKYFQNTGLFSQVRLFYLAPQGSAVNISLNQGTAVRYPLAASSLPQELTVTKDSIRQVKITAGGNLSLFGVSLEDSTGFYIDNFSMKGNSGIPFSGLRDDFLARSAEILPYDLIVLQFGLNVMNEKTKNYSGYAKNMVKVVEKFRLAYPDTPVLIVSIPDKSIRRQGEYITSPSILPFVAMQEKIAADNNLLFWNMFAAMGGEGSMAEMANAKPPLANKDYTHLNYAGGKVVGITFVDALLHEIEKALTMAEQNQNTQ